MVLGIVVGTSNLCMEITPVLVLLRCCEILGGVLTRNDVVCVACKAVSYIRCKPYPL